MTAPSDVIRKHIEAFNARDQGAEPWSAGAEMVSPAGTVTGRDQVLAFLGAFRGTHNGVLHAPAGDIGPTGKSIEFRWAAIYRTEGDQLASEHLFFDQLDFLGQLGIGPAPG